MAGTFVCLNANEDPVIWESLTFRLGSAGGVSGCGQSVGSVGGVRGCGWRVWSTGGGDIRVRAVSQHATCVTDGWNLVECSPTSEINIRDLGGVLHTVGKHSDWGHAQRHGQRLS